MMAALLLRSNWELNQPKWGQELRGLGTFHCCLFSFIQNSFKGKGLEMRELREGQEGILYFSLSMYSVC